MAVCVGAYVLKVDEVGVVRRRDQPAEDAAGTAHTTQAAAHRNQPRPHPHTHPNSHGPPADMPTRLSNHPGSLKPPRAR